MYCVVIDNKTYNQGANCNGLGSQTCAYLYGSTQCFIGEHVFCGGAGLFNIKWVVAEAIGFDLQHKKRCIRKGLFH